VYQANSIIPPPTARPSLAQSGVVSGYRRSEQTKEERDPFGLVIFRQEAHPQPMQQRRHVLHFLGRSGVSDSPVAPAKLDAKPDEVGTTHDADCVSKPRRNGGSAHSGRTWSERHKSVSQR